MGKQASEHPSGVK